MPDEPIIDLHSDRYFMGEALRQARRALDSEEIPVGAVTAIVRHNKLVWYEAQGVRDAKSEAKMGKDDLFRMMSSSKPVTAVAVLGPRFVMLIT